jgi:hypothetical protein
MIQDFLNSIAGNSAPPRDPMENLIPKHLQGVRSYKKYFNAILGVGSAMLAITLSEVHPVFNSLIVFGYLVLIASCMLELLEIQKKNGYITKSKVQMYIIFYLIVALIMTFLISIVKAI